MTETLAAPLTEVRFIPSAVDVLVSLQVRRLTEPPVAQLTTEGLFSAVDAQVLLQVA